MVGTPLAVGLDRGPYRAIMQISGEGLRVKADVLTETLVSAPELRAILSRYVLIQGLQVAQIAACNRLHEIEQRLARWLLMCQDRIGSNFVPLTQEFLAHMLGTRRASVTVAAGILQKAGLITYSRGHVNIVDRTRLENACCECYAIMQEQDLRWRNEAS
jgi:CRP-like cAMP-binding protein